MSLPIPISNLTARRLVVQHKWHSPWNLVITSNSLVIYYPNFLLSHVIFSFLNTHLILREFDMKALDIVHVVAGFFILTGIILAIFVHPWWLALSAFVGLNLFQFGITGFCPLVWLLRKTGIES